jgi:DNA invertase Pin-like site-specific DNA recombinase
LLGPAKIEELCLLLNDIHVRLEMLKEIAATEPSPEFDRLLEEIKMQEVVVLAKLAQLGVKM